MCHARAPPRAGLLHSRRWTIAAFPVAVIARHYHVAPGTIRSWVSEDRISGQADPHERRRKVYELGDIQRAYDKRHGRIAT